MSERRAAVLTVSDGVVDGTREDRSGQALAELLTASGFQVRRDAVPDERPLIAAAIETLADHVQLVVTTGGTGLGPRDVTPEATRQVIDREAPGLAEAMRAAGRASTPLADLSRAVTGSIGTTLVVNLPGSPAGAIESLDAILAVVPHALDLLAGHTRHGHADETGTKAHGHEDEATSLRHRPPHDRHVHAEGRPPDGEGGDDVLDALTSRRQAGEDLVLATAVRTTGTPPCRSGQKLLLSREDGPTLRPVAGTLGCAEFDGAATADAPGVLASGEPTVAFYEHDDGTVEVALEPFVRRPPLVVIGATPIALWLLRWGRDLGYDPVLVEARSERVASEHRAAAARTLHAIEEVDLTASAVVVHTDHDDPDVAGQLAVAVSSPAGYVGLVGSRRHADEHLAAVRDAGAEGVDRIRTPVGLDLGSRTPQEIALSILAEVVATRTGRSGGSLASS